MPFTVKNKTKGNVRAIRFTGAFTAERVLNPKTASSQLRSGVIWGIGAALMEKTTMDERDGNFIIHNFADYHSPVGLAHAAAPRRAAPALQP